MTEPPIDNNHSHRRNYIRRVIHVVFSIALTATMLFASAGTIVWYPAWLFIALSLLVILVNIFIMPSGLIAERGRKKENVEQWDKKLGGYTDYSSRVKYRLLPGIW